MVMLACGQERSAKFRRKVCVYCLIAQNVIVFDRCSSFDGGITVRSEVGALNSLGIVVFGKTASLATNLGKMAPYPAVSTRNLAFKRGP